MCGDNVNPLDLKYIPKYVNTGKRIYGVWRKNVYDFICIIFYLQST
jgi:hypothetical protein